MPLPYLKKECQSLFYAYVACFLGLAGRPQKRELPIPEPSRILNLPSLFKHHFHKSRHTEQMRNSAVTSSKYCFGLEALPYRTNIVQTCCIICLKNILEVFVFHFKTSQIPFFPGYILQPSICMTPIFIETLLLIIPLITEK